MNIFYLSASPAEAARWMVDKHVVKMILESAQLMSTAHRVVDGRMYVGKTATGRNIKRYRLDDARDSVLYSATHINHPSAVWARQSVENYNWLFEHFFALGQEYTHRYGKTHKCFQGDLAYMLSSPPHGVREYAMTKMPSAMDEQYIVSDDPIVNYRNYYRLGKINLHSWKNRQPPEWINT